MTLQPEENPEACAEVPVARITCHFSGSTGFATWIRSYMIMWMGNPEVCASCRTQSHDTYTKYRRGVIRSIIRLSRDATRSPSLAKPPIRHSQHAPLPKYSLLPSNISTHPPWTTSNPAFNQTSTSTLPKQPEGLTRTLIRAANGSGCVWRVLFSIRSFGIRLRGMVSRLWKFGSRWG